MANFQTTWTDADIEMLRALWTEGRTAAQISIALEGRHSRNGVCGKASRLKLECRDSPINRTHYVKPKKPTKPKTKAAVVVQSIIPEPIFLCEPGDMPDKGCMFPKGDGPTMIFCGHATERKRFCAYHAAVAYIKPTNIKPVGNMNHASRASRVIR